MVCGNIYSQQAIVPAGGNVSGSGGSVSSTIGQIVYCTNSGSSGSEAQGVQQPFEISVVTEIENETEIQLSMIVYPNPAVDELTLIIENDQVEFFYQLYNANGNLLESKQIVNSETLISMKFYAKGVYFFKILDKSTEIKTFKIIKN